MVILDTCAIIEALKPLPSFSSKTTKLMDNGAGILSISFAEIACKVNSGKLEINISPRELAKQFGRVLNMNIIDIGVEEWLDSIDLDWEDNRDPADRVITSYAKKNELAIVTMDKKIKKFYKKVIW